jgi:SAM-dependent methyltransferase
MPGATDYAFVERAACPACLSRDVETVYESRFDEGAVGTFMRSYYGIDPSMLGSAPYRLVRCSACTLLYQSWVGDDRLLGDLYGQWISEAGSPEHDPVYAAVMAAPLESRDAHEIMTVAAFLQKTPSELVTLDHGMGWAMWARIALGLGCRSYGTELSPSRQDFARRHGIEVPAENTLPERRFDFINAEQVMEHLPQPRQTAECLARALRPKGILKVSVPSGHRAGRAIDQLRAGRPVISNDDFMPVQPLEHVNAFTRQSLHDLAKSLGLDIVRPSLVQRYAFVARRGTLSTTRLRNSVKELARPFYTYRNPSNLYVWMQRPAEVGA